MFLSRNAMHTNYVLVSQETMADFFKIAHIPRVIGAGDGSMIPIRAPFNDEHMYLCHKGFHAINKVVCRDLFMIQQFSMAACSMQTLKMAVDKMGIVAMGSSHIF